MLDFEDNSAGKLVSVCLAPLGNPVVIDKRPLSDRKLEAYALENEIPMPAIESKHGVDAYFFPLIDPTTFALKLSSTISTTFVF